MAQSQPPSGAMIGQKGVKYGLQLRGAPKAGAATAPRRPVAGPPSGKLAAFGGDSDSEDEGVGAQVARQADKKRANQKVQELYAQALMDDPSVFDYDGVYDDLQAQRSGARAEAQAQKQSRYIATLMEQATARKREQDIAHERRLLKEREKEDAQFEAGERFVTAAYRRKLEEDAKWQAAQKAKEAEEDASAASKLGHMNNFYKNLLTSNVAFGAAAAAPATAEPSACGEGDAARRAAGAGGSREAGAGEQLDEAALEGLSEYERVRARAAAAARAAARERRAADADAGPSGGLPPEAGSGGGGGASAEQLGADAADPPAAPRASDAARSDPDGARPPGGLVATDEASAAAEAAAPVPAAVLKKRRNDDAAVASARERYLARRKQQG